MERHLAQVEAEAVEEAVQHQEHEQQDEDTQVVHRDHALVCDVPAASSQTTPPPAQRV